MSSVLQLALPFFGLVFIGFFCGKLMRFEEDGLKWMNFFIVYVALPCLFYKLISQVRIEQFAYWPFFVTTVISTYAIFAIAFMIGLYFTRGHIQNASIQAFLGCYSNIGYMGPGLTLGALGPAAAVPTALILMCDNLLMFILLPLMMGLGSAEKMRVLPTIWFIFKRIVTHPFNIASAAGLAGGIYEIELPPAIDKMVIWLFQAAAPAALFTLGVTLALRPFHGVKPEIPALLAIKLVLHPLMVWALLGIVGDFPKEWVYSAMLMACLPPALNVFVMARQYETYIDGASAGVLAGTVASVATVTALLYLMAAGILPVKPF